MIIDFGSCYSAGIGEISARIDRESKLGTRDYCAPEYLLNTPVSPLSDQFSLGVLLYELLTGKHPFGEAYSRCQTEEDFERLRYVPAYRVNPLVPVWLDNAIHKALSIEPDRRYQALTEFAQDIKKPNPELMARRSGVPSLKQSLFIWKIIAIGLALSNLVMAVVLLSGH